MDNQTNKGQRQSVDPRPSKQEEKKRSILEKKDSKSNLEKKDSKSNLEKKDSKTNIEKKDSVPGKGRVGFDCDTVERTESQLLTDHINLLCRQVHDNFISATISVKKAYDENEALKAFRNQASDLSELWTEVAKTFQNKAPSISKEEVRNALNNAAKVVLKQASILRSKFADVEEYVEEILLCSDTCLVEFRRLDKTIRPVSGDAITLLRKAIVVALEETLATASSLFGRRSKA